MKSIPNFRALPRDRRLLSAFVLALICAACGEAPPPAAPALPTPSIPRISDKVEAAGTDGVEVAARYPAMRSELAPLDAAMHAYTETQQAALAARIKKLKLEAERAERPGKLDLDFTIATQTVAFVSALAQGQADVGDGKPTPLRAAFNLHLASGRIVALGDLFTDADAVLKLFSDEARRRLYAEYEARLYNQNLAQAELTARMKAMHALVDKGTEPTAENFASFLVDGVDGKAIGITLIFPPGQVADETEGAQQVEVPVKLFADKIKSEYGDAFDQDSAAPNAQPTSDSPSSR
ncbi:MAG: hypothetical protein QM741_04080 [Rudaea sp.]|uniref:hypothetical protein n=1 Tax=Rudaea sp. TaxID=2136325 RepID=UPI0039E26EB0